MRGSRKFFQRVSNFSVDKGIRVQNATPLLMGPLSARKRNAIEMAFRLRADDGPTLNAGLVAL